jgi:hypothetical protein
MNFRTATVTAGCVAFLAQPTFATSIFLEQFDQAPGALVSGSGGNWVTHSGTANQIQVIATPSESGNSLLSPLSGVKAPSGNRITINGTDTEDVSRPFTAVTGNGNSVYAAFLVRFTAQPSAGGAYFAHFCEGNSTSNFFARLYARSSGAGFNIGLGRTNETATWDTTVFNLNETYHIVLRYGMVAGATNDIVEVHVNPASVTVEGTPLIAINNTSAELNPATGIGRFSFRQASGIGTMEIDQVQVATTYATAAPLPVSMSEFSIE